MSKIKHFSKKKSFREFFDLCMNNHRDYTNFNDKYPTTVENAIARSIRLNYMTTAFIKEFTLVILDLLSENSKIKFYKPELLLNVQFLESYLSNALTLLGLLDDYTFVSKKEEKIDFSNKSEFQRTHNEQRILYCAEKLSKILENVNYFYTHKKAHDAIPKQFRKLVSAAMTNMSPKEQKEHLINEIQLVLSKDPWVKWFIFGYTNFNFKDAPNKLQQALVELGLNRIPVNTAYQMSNNKDLCELLATSIEKNPKGWENTLLNAKKWKKFLPAVYRQAFAAELELLNKNYNLTEAISIYLKYLEIFLAHINTFMIIRTADPNMSSKDVSELFDFIVKHKLKGKYKNKEYIDLLNNI
jgi:hypothetical protein